MTDQEKISLQNLSEENSRLSAENSALVESLTAVYYQSFSGKRELAEDRAHAEELEKKLSAAELANKNLLESNKGLCQALRETRDSIKTQAESIAVLKKKAKTKNVIIIVVVLLFVAYVFASIMLLKQGRGSRGLVMDLREASHRFPELAEALPDEIRYTFEDVFKVKW